VSRFGQLNLRRMEEVEAELALDLRPLRVRRFLGGPGSTPVLLDGLRKIKAKNYQTWSTVHYRTLAGYLFMYHYAVGLLLDRFGILLIISDPCQIICYDL